MKPHAIFSILIKFLKKIWPNNFSSQIFTPVDYPRLFTSKKNTKIFEPFQNMKEWPLYFVCIITKSK